MKKTLWSNKQYILFFLFFCGADAFVYPYLSLFFSQRGLASGQIGAINALSYLATVAAGLLLGLLADRSGRPRLVLTLSILGVVAAVLGLTASRAFWALGLAAVAYTFFYVPSGDLADKLLLDRLREQSRIFSVFRFSGPLGYSLGVLAAGGLAVRLPLQRVFFLGAGVMLLSALLTLGMPAGRVDTGGPRPSLGSVLRQPSAPYLYGMMLLWGFVESGALPYIAVFMADSGFAEDYTAALIAIAMMGQIAGYLGLPALAGRLGRHTMIGVGFFLMALRIATFALVTRVHPIGMLALQFISGLSQPFVLASITAMISQDFPQGGGSTAQTLKTAFNRGIGGSLGALLFGWLYGVWAPWQVMCFYGALSLLICLLGAAWGRRVYRGLPSKP